MAAAPALPLLLGLLAAVLGGSRAAVSTYSELSEALRGGVDLALDKLHGHAGIQHHFVFLRSVSKSDIQVQEAGGFAVPLVFPNVLRVCAGARACVFTASVLNSPAQFEVRQSLNSLEAGLKTLFLKKKKELKISKRKAN